jgi:hypothetical protein
MTSDTSVSVSGIAVGPRSTKLHLSTQLHLLNLCRACIAQVSEKPFVAANMMLDCHNFDLFTRLNSFCWFLFTFDICSIAEFYKCCWM